MRVLNVNILLDQVTGGGTAERTFQISRFMARTGINCTVLTTDIGLTPKRIRDLKGVKVVALSCLNRRLYIPRTSYSVVKNIVKHVDIIHLMNHWTFLNILIYYAARRFKKPYVVCPAGALPIYGRSKIFKTIYNQVVGGKIIRNANGHVAIGMNELEQFKHYGIESERVTIIPNGVDPEDFQANDIADFRGRYNLDSAPFIMFMGRLNHIKGPDLLLRAFCNVKNEILNYHLVFVGPDGGMLRRLKKTVAESGVRDRVHFLGYLGGLNKSQAYHAADLLVIPSRQEAMSIVVLEAGVTGTPVLLTNECGFDDVVRVGGGHVVSASVGGLQKGLIKILRDQAQLKTMGENLKKYVFDCFIWDAIINKYNELYLQILDTNR